MASLFGEIVHPSSRAFWTEEEDDEASEITESLTSFTVEWLEDAPSKIKNLIIVETHLIIDFAREYVIKGAENICTIKSATSSNSSMLYKATDHLFLLTISPDVDLTVAGDFVESISEILRKCENIVAVTCNHISQLKSIEETANPAFLRCLSTTKASKERIIKKLIPALNQPNIVSGVAAGVVAYAEMVNLSAILNVLYLDGFELDSETAAPLIKLFSSLTDHKLAQFKSLNKSLFNKGNLYM